MVQAVAMSLPARVAHDAALSAEQFVWLIGSLCRLHHLPFDGALLLQQFPPPHDRAQLFEALRAFGFRVGSTSLVAAPVFIVMVGLCGWAIMLLMRHERSRADLQVALDQNRVLLQEIHHRVKNNLQQVSSLVRLQQAPAVFARRAVVAAVQRDREARGRLAQVGGQVAKPAGRRVGGRFRAHVHRPPHRRRGRPIGIGHGAVWPDNLEQRMPGQGAGGQSQCGPRAR